MNDTIRNILVMPWAICIAVCTVIIEEINEWGRTT
jgi:hypothetical protein